MAPLNTHSDHLFVPLTVQHLKPRTHGTSLPLLSGELVLLDSRSSLQYKHSQTHGSLNETWLIDMLTVKVSSELSRNIEYHGKMPLLHTKAKDWQPILCGSRLPWCLESSLHPTGLLSGLWGDLAGWDHGQEEGPSRHPQGRRPVPHRHHHFGPTFPQDLTGCATLASKPVRPPGANPRAPRGSQGRGLIKILPLLVTPAADLLPRFSFCSKHHHGERPASFVRLL